MYFGRKCEIYSYFNTGVVILNEMSLGVGVGEEETCISTEEGADCLGISS